MSLVFLAQKVEKKYNNRKTMVKIRLNNKLCLRLKDSRTRLWLLIKKD